MSLADNQLITNICESLYQTGFNDGQHNIVYYPNPVKFRADQIIKLLAKKNQKMIEERTI